MDDNQPINDNSVDRDTLLADDDRDDDVDYSNNDDIRRVGKRKYLTWPIVTVEIVGIIGVLCVLFAVYILAYTNVETQQHQNKAYDDLTSQWDKDGNKPNPKPMPNSDFADGDAMVVVRAPDMMGDQKFVAFKGTDQKTLSRGPGVYDDSNPVGTYGNFSLAAHRDGWMKPFADIDKLHTCSEVTIETRDRILTYRVVSSEDSPEKRFDENKACMSERMSSALNRKGYRDMPGRSVVDPNAGSVTWSVPRVSTDPMDADVSLLTLTTCHPHWSNAHRYVVHAVNVSSEYKKDQ